MSPLIFFSNNKNKIKEIKNYFENSISIYSLSYPLTFLPVVGYLSRTALNIWCNLKYFLFPRFASYNNPFQTIGIRYLLLIFEVSMSITFANSGLVNSLSLALVTIQFTISGCFSVNSSNKFVFIQFFLKPKWPKIIINDCFIFVLLCEWYI